MAVFLQRLVYESRFESFTSNVVMAFLLLNRFLIQHANYPFNLSNRQQRGLLGSTARRKMCLWEKIQKTMLAAETNRLETRTAYGFAGYGYDELASEPTQL